MGTLKIGGGCFANMIKQNINRLEMLQKWEKSESKRKELQEIIENLRYLCDKVE